MPAPRREEEENASCLRSNCPTAKSAKSPPPPAPRRGRVDRQTARPGRRRRQGRRRRRRPRPRAANGAGELAFQILTDKDPEALDVLRHSCAHVMARAVMRLFPGVQLAFGPTIENGFYYDIDSPTPIREEDFPAIEAEMRRSSRPPSRSSASSEPRAEGRGHLPRPEARLKVEHIDDDLAKHPTLCFYRQGEFIDLCRGPHIPHAGKIGAFKLLSIAGAYWKNDATRKQLQRLYGTAFFTQKDLDAYLKQLEEAKKRDHRVLGKQLKLFTISQLVGSGLILWMPKGATVRGILETSSRTSCSSAATSRSTRRTSAGWSCTAPAATSRTTAMPSSRRCTSARSPGADLSTRLAAGVLDESASKSVDLGRTYLHAAGTTEAKLLEAVHHWPAIDGLH